MDASPVKRRVLGALDPNACSPKARHDGKLAGHSPAKARAVPPRPTLAAATSPIRVLSSAPSSVFEAQSRKRRSPTPTPTPTPGMASRATDGHAETEPAAKRARFDHPREEASPRSLPSSSTTRSTTATTRHRSASPDTSSVFDTSAVDNSQVTVLTEPDTPAPAPARLPRARLTREQAREKAEILRLRLGLASYKVRTGQTDVPLDRLEVRPLEEPSSKGLARAASFSHHHHHRPSHRHQSSLSASFPPPADSTATAAGRRRPLPGGSQARRASITGGVGSGSSAAAAAAAAVLAAEKADIARAGRALGALDERASLLEQNHRQHHHHHQQQQQQQHRLHQRRQSEVWGTGGYGRSRPYADVGVPPRPRTATDGLPATLFRERRSSVVAEEDLGGAASGLLSLARS